MSTTSTLYIIHIAVHYGEHVLLDPLVYLLRAYDIEDCCACVASAVLKMVSEASYAVAGQQVSGRL